MIAQRFLLPHLLAASLLHGQLPPTVEPAAKQALPADFNRDGSVNMADVTLLRSALGGRNATYDLNGDGRVSLLDFFLLADSFGRHSANPRDARSDILGGGPIRIPQGASYTVDIDPTGRATTVHTEVYEITIQKGEPFGIVSLRLAGQAFDFAHSQLPLADWEWFTYHRPAYEPLLERKLLQEIWEGPEASARDDGISLRYRVQNVMRIGVDVEVIYHLQASNAAFEVEYAIHNGASHALETPYAMVGFPGFSNHRWINVVTAASEVRRARPPHGNFQSEADARGLPEYSLLRQDVDAVADVELRGSIAIETTAQTYRLDTSFSPSGGMTDISFAHINKPPYLTSHLYAAMKDLEAGGSRSFTVTYRLATDVAGVVDASAGEQP